MLGTLGGPELIIILFIVLIIFGAGKLGDVGGSLGKGIREFKKATAGEYDESEARVRADALSPAVPSTSMLRGCMIDAFA